MRKLIIFISVSFVACLANANSGNNLNRYDLTSLTCDYVEEILDVDGAAIFTYDVTRSGNVLFKKFVRNDMFCDSSEIVKKNYYNAVDGDCVLYTCVPHPGDNPGEPGGGFGYGYGGLSD